MNDIPTFASAPLEATRPAEASPRRYSLATLRSIIAAWREPTRFRWDLKRLAETNPHLIDDIGLTRRQAEEEIAKLPFWQR
ncbi:DUF1127 domain-containing protein [Mesorhizobium sp. M0833]|uniref:DUF1127 domain-containing protein n=1 Tax=unclassified Mesorhizobium TaxID=325217 RepID=UPI0020C93BBA|nr:DUF1127 domain-containing protein [Mesorhizobium sp. LMG 17147]MCP9231681.1 DUF1127 domain-containing protein [Mesorhizobium sp. LMG 17147]